MASKIRNRHQNIVTLRAVATDHHVVFVGVFSLLAR